SKLRRLNVRVRSKKAAASSFNAGMRAGFDARKAGASPKITPASNEIPNVNKSTRQSIENCGVIGSAFVGGVAALNERVVHHASSSPAVPPNVASSTPSVNN